MEQECITYIIVVFIVMVGACRGQMTNEELPKDFPSMQIKIEAEHRIKLKRKRQEALGVGLLNSKDDDFVPASIRFQNNQYSGMVRLKGDWLDHLKSDKWSFRIKLDSSQSIMGMQTFSIQHPQTRFYLYEFVFHQLLLDEHILTPRYEFIHVQLNGRNQGIYALEEHFHRFLLEKQGRREGPIIRFSEDGFWEAQKYFIENKQDLTFSSPIFEAAEIEAFQKNRTRKNDQLFQQFISGRQRLEDFRNLENIEASIDIDAWAKLFAICDLTQAYHTLTWHNLRFYYNPFTTKLEPVVFDGNTKSGPYQWFSKPYLGFYSGRYSKVYLRQEFLIFQLFNNLTFLRKYQQYLQVFSQPSYLNSFFDKHGKEIESLDSLLNREYGQERYDRSFLDLRANEIRKFLLRHQFEHPPFEYEIFDKSYNECQARYPLESVSIGASRLMSPNEKTVSLSNYFCQPVQVVATGPHKSRPIHLLTTPVSLPAFDIHFPAPNASLEMDVKDQYIFYKIESNTSWYRKKISKIPSKNGKYEFSMDNLNWDTTIFKTVFDTIYLIPGNHQIKKLQIFPKDKILVLDAGSKIDLVQQGGFLIKGSLIMRGTVDRPIDIISSDNLGNGFSVIGDEKYADISWTRFDNLKPLKAPGSWLTGGLTFYNTRLNMEDCKIMNTRSEDAINIVSSMEVNLTGISFENCLEDGIDIDFSKAVVKDCSFSTIGGDAIDISGSQLSISNIRVNRVLDKAFSIGENTSAEMNQLTVENAIVGLAAKDGSNVKMQNAIFKHSNHAILVYNKKHHYGRSSISIANLTLQENESDFGIEMDQGVTLDGRNLQPTDTLFHFAKILPIYQDK